MCCRNTVSNIGVEMAVGGVVGFSNGYVSRAGDYWDMLCFDWDMLCFDWAMLCFDWDMLCFDSRYILLCFDLPCPYTNIT